MYIQCSVCGERFVNYPEFTKHFVSIHPIVNPHLAKPLFTSRPKIVSQPPQTDIQHYTRPPNVASQPIGFSQGLSQGLTQKFGFSQKVLNAPPTPPNILATKVPIVSGQGLNLVKAKFADKCPMQVLTRNKEICKHSTPTNKLKGCLLIKNNCFRCLGESGKNHQCPVAPRIATQKGTCFVCLLPLEYPPFKHTSLPKNSVCSIGMSDVVKTTTAFVYRYQRDLLCSILPPAILQSESSYFQWAYEYHPNYNYMNAVAITEWFIGYLASL